LPGRRLSSGLLQHSIPALHAVLYKHLVLQAGWRLLGFQRVVVVCALRAASCTAGLVLQLLSCKTNWWLNQRGIMCLGNSPTMMDSCQ
jgi:hypothetical protein